MPCTNSTFNYFKNFPTRCIAIFLVIVTLQSCKTDNSKRVQERRTKFETAVNQPESFLTGQIINSVDSRSNKSQSYALYIPGSYVTTNKDFPIIYFFDPHARGNLPIKKYFKLAEKYEYILVGSNNSRNGLPQSDLDKITSGLLNDTKQRLSINNNRIYVAGFSGGARVASLLAIENNYIKGVAGCGGGLPKSGQLPGNMFSFIGFVGNEDFNYLEMRYLSFELERIKINSQLIVFEGKHEWPENIVFEDAFAWFEINAMKEKLIPRNDTLISNFKKKIINEINVLEKRNEIMPVTKLYQKLINYLSQIEDVSVYSQKLSEITGSQIIIGFKEEEAQLENMEYNLQQYLLKLYSSNDLVQLKSEINNIKTGISQNNNPQEIPFLKRTINFLSMITFSKVNTALNSDNSRQAGEYLEIYKILTPEVPEYSYLSACYFVKTSKYNKALIALEEAINNGFDDLKKLQTDKILDPLRSKQRFQEMVEQLELSGN